MACACDRQNGNGGASYYDQAPPPPALAIVPGADPIPEWVRQLFFAVLVALIVGLIMRQTRGAA